MTVPQTDDPLTDDEKRVLKTAAYGAVLLVSKADPGFFSMSSSHSCVTAAMFGSCSRAFFSSQSIVTISPLAAWRPRIRRLRPLYAFDGKGGWGSSRRPNRTPKPLHRGT